MDADVMAKVLPFLPMNFPAFALLLLGLVFGVLLLAVGLNVVRFQFLSTLWDSALGMFAKIDFSLVWRQKSSRTRLSNDHNNFELEIFPNDVRLPSMPGEPTDRPPI
jgi:hypothetical protein